MTLTRRGLLAAGTVATLLPARKPCAAEMGTLAAVSPHPAPGVAFQAADGTARTLGAFKGRPLLVNLWATWCPPCVAELPSLSALAHTLFSEGMVVLPISSDRGGAEAVEAFYTAHEIHDLPVLLDHDAALMHAFGARGLPSTYVIDREGNIVGMEEGGMDWNRPGVAEAVRRLAGAKPA